jgi:hypothetical protein
MVLQGIYKNIFICNTVWRDEDIISVLGSTCAGQLTNLTFLSLDPSSQVRKLRFETVGEFRLEFESLKPGLVLGFFLSESDPRFSLLSLGSA